MKIKGYSKKRMFGLLLLPALACTWADSIAVSPAMAGTTTVPALSTRNTTVPLSLTDTLINNGTIDLSGGVGTAVTVDSSATGVTINNDGQIIADSAFSAIFVDNSASGTTINNYSGASISAFGNAWGAIAYGSSGILAGPNGLSGTLHNDGTIFAGAKIGSTASSATGIYIYGDLAGTLENTGEITAVARDEASNFGWTSATVSNAHGITMTGDLVGTLNNTGLTSAILGEVSASATATGTSYASAYAYGYKAYGIQMGNLSGSLTNEGAIEAVLTASATANGGETTPGTPDPVTYAYASATASSAYGLNMNGGIDAGKTLTNSGTISAAITVTASATEGPNLEVPWQTDAYVSGQGAYGLNMGTLSGTLQNSGALSAITADVDVTATATGDAVRVFAVGYSVYGVNMGDISRVDVDNYGHLINEGTISATLSQTATANGVVDAFATAYNSWANYNVYGVNLGQLAGQLDNSGTIEAVLTSTAEATATGNGATGYAYAYATGYSAHGLNVWDITADGSLSNTGTASAILGEVDATATAHGTTSAWASAYAQTANGIIVSNLSGSLSNAGTIEAVLTASATANGGETTPGTPDPADSAYASARGYRAYALDLGGQINSGENLTNSGTVNAAITVTASVNEGVSGDWWSTDAYATGYSAYGINMGTLAGTLTNSGATSAITADVDVTATATGEAVRAYAAGYSVYGVNLGDISRVDVDNYGHLSNAGTISAALSQTATANGVVDATASAYMGWGSGYNVYGVNMGQLAGQLDNSGTIEAILTSTAEATATGNGSTGYAYAYATGYSAHGLNVWDITSDGSLSNTGTASAIRGEVDATATAHGTTSAWASAYAQTAYGLVVSNLSGSLSNAGTIEAVLTASATANGGETTPGTPDPADSAYASARGYRAYALDLGGQIGSGESLINSGTINAAITVTASVNEGVGGDWWSTDAYATGYSAYGINMGTLAGTLTNSGALSAITADVTVAATADGDAVRAYAAGYSVYGVNLGDISRVDVDNYGHLSNAGTISAALSQTATANGVVDATASAYMGWGSGYNVYGVNMGQLAGQLDNSGTIEAILTSTAEATATGNGATGYAFAYADGKSVYGLNVWDITADGSLSNTGTTSAIRGEVDTTATAHGTTSASAYAYAQTAFGVFASNLSGSLTNAGTIEAKLTAMADATASGAANAQAVAGTSRGPAVGVYISTVSSSATLDNSGTISGTATATATATGTSTSASASAFAAGLMVDTINAGATLTVTNSGAIQAIASATSTGTAADSAVGAYVGTLNGTLKNSNAISGQATLPQDGYSLYVNTGTGMVSNLAGGLLSGNLYTGGTVQVNNSGTIAIPMGVTANVSGDYHQTAGGALQIGADSASNYGKLVVGGTATFDADAGINVNVAKVNTLAIDDSLADVVTAGSLSASTFTVTDNSALLNFEAVIDSNTIDLNAIQAPVTDIIVGPGAGTLPALLTEMLNNPDAYPRMADLLDALNKLETDSDVARAVNSLLPFLNGDQKRALFSALHETRRIVRVRADDSKGLNSGDEIAVDRNLWGKVFGSKADQDDNRGVAGYEADSYGIILGADTDLNARARLGAALAYVKSDVDGDTIASQDAEIDSYQAILYGSYALGKETNLGWQADAAWHENDTERAIPFMGMKAKGDYDSWSVHAGVDASHRVALGEKTALTPSVRIDYTRIDEEDYTETGAGALNLKVNGNEVDELILGMDAKLTHNLTGNAMLTANVGVGYDALADEKTITSSFAGAPGAAFKTTGIDPEPWLVNAGVGAEFGAKDGVQLNLRYDIEDRDDYTNQSVSLKVKVPF